jgi:hypothetical protein
MLVKGGPDRSGGHTRIARHKTETRSKFIPVSFTKTHPSELHLRRLSSWNNQAAFSKLRCSSTTTCHSDFDGIWAELTYLQGGNIVQAGMLAFNKFPIFQWH